jgi:hypothetical protein
MEGNVSMTCFNWLMLFDCAFTFCPGLASTALQYCLAGQSPNIASLFTVSIMHLISPSQIRTGCAIKNRWNWMMSGKRKGIFDKVVRQNADLFGQILQATCHPS